jgi:hypothetical protein
MIGAVPELSSQFRLYLPEEQLEPREACGESKLARSADFGFEEQCYGRSVPAIRAGRCAVFAAFFAPSARAPDQTS